MDSSSYSNIPSVSSAQNELDPEAQHLANLTRQLMVQPSPMQPAHHDGISAPSPAPKATSGLATPAHSASSSALASASAASSAAAAAIAAAAAEGGSGHPKSVSAATPSLGGGATPASNLEPSTPSSNLMSGGLFSVGAGGPMTPRTPITPMSVDHQIVPQLQNIVSTVNLGCKLDLKKIALHARNAEYNPKRFAAVIMRIREPRTTALIFR